MGGLYADWHSVVNAQSQIEQNGIQEIKYLLDLAFKALWRAIWVVEFWGVCVQDL